MLLFYLRHGDPIYDPDSLTEQGMLQAEALSKRLSRYGIDKIFASTSNRAILTARPTADALSKEIAYLDWCNESHAWRDLTVRKEDGKLIWGFQYKPIAEFFLSESITTLGRQWYEHPEFSNTRFKEGFLRIERETYSFLEELGYKHDYGRRGYVATRPNDERVALFAHQGFGLAFLSALLDIPYPEFCTRFDIGHTGMTVIDFSSDDGFVIPKVLQLSNDSHLYREDLPTKYNNRILI